MMLYTAKTLVTAMIASRAFVVIEYRIEWPTLGWKLEIGTGTITLYMIAYRLGVRVSFYSNWDGRLFGWYLRPRYRRLLYLPRFGNLRVMTNGISFMVGWYLPSGGTTMFAYLGPLRLEFSKRGRS